MEKILAWVQTELPLLLQQWGQALLTKSVLVQLGALAAASLLMFPVGRLLVRLYLRIAQSLELGTRLAGLLNRLRALFFREPLSEEGGQLLVSCLRSLEVLGRPLAAYLLLLAAQGPVAAIQDVDAQILARVAPLFVVWAAYRWLCAILPLFVREEPFVALRKRFLTPLFWIACTLQFFGQLEASLSFFKTPLLQLAGASISLKSLFFAVAILYVFLKLSSQSRSFLQDGLLPKLKVTPALNNTLATFVSYVLVGLGFFLAISTLGFSGSSLTVLFGALTVGIGFGLQSIINNFVSGLILLAEQSIAPGDVIDIGGKTCVVEHIRIRSTTVRTYDNVELRVPNSKLLGDVVESHTGGEARTRTKIRLGVSYSSDPLQVQQLCVQAAESLDEVLDDPSPKTMFVDFGDNALLFDINVWVADPRRIPAVQSQLRYTVWYVLKDAGVDMPFPQRRLHLGEGWSQLAGGQAPARLPQGPQASSPSRPQASSPSRQGFFAPPLPEKE